ncbi:MAG: hypothetical protein ACHQEM_06190 [Chitinophagales bacterium]
MKRTILLALGTTLFLACNNKPAETTEAAKDTTAAVKETKPPAQSEFADPKYVEIGKANLAKLSSGDIDGFADSYADNAVYVWSRGDSVAGKPAIIKYWKERRGKVIDSLKYFNDVWLAIKVNTSQKPGADLPGVWVMAWYGTSVKYKNKNKVVFYAHTLNHFNDNDKIDRTIMFIDYAPINKASGVVK